MHAVRCLHEAAATVDRHDNLRHAAQIIRRENQLYLCKYIRATSRVCRPMRIALTVVIQAA